jgi:hypothetical protein
VGQQSSTCTAAPGGVEDGLDSLAKRLGGGASRDGGQVNGGQHQHLLRRRVVALGRSGAMFYAQIPSVTNKNIMETLGTTKLNVSAYNVNESYAARSPPRCVDDDMAGSGWSTSPHLSHDGLHDVLHAGAHLGKELHHLVHGHVQRAAEGARVIHAVAVHVCCIFI